MSCWLSSDYFGNENRTEYGVKPLEPRENGTTAKRDWTDPKGNSTGRAPFNPFPLGQFRLVAWFILSALIRHAAAVLSDNVVSGAQPLRACD